LQVTLDLGLAPDGAVPLPEERRREVFARGQVVQERLRSHASYLRRFDGGEEGFPARNRPANRLQKSVLGARAAQEELRRRHPARVRLLHQIREPMELLGVAPQVLKDLDVALKGLGHEEFSPFRRDRAPRSEGECRSASDGYSNRNMFAKGWV
jgi:hypothetical protein